MSKFYTRLFIFFFFIFFNSERVFSQITINGPRSQNLYRSGGGELYVSLSYGYILWKDSKQKEFKGSSASLVDYNLINEFMPISIDKFDYSQGLSFGIEKKITDGFAIKGHLFHAKLHTGVSTRVDIESTDDKSKFSQIAVYSSLTLTRDKGRRLQFQWLAGPEIFYAQRDLILKSYIENPDDEPQDYHYKETVVEGAIVTGLGISFRIAEKFTLYSDGLVGLSLPGTGIKITSNNIGLKYKIR